jgi:replicative DNA helicase
MNLDKLSRIPPQNIEAEQSILGSIMLDKDIIPDIMAILKSRDFYREDHQEIFDAIYELHNSNKPIDIITVSEQLNIQGMLNNIGGLEYLANITSSVATTANVIHYAKIVEEKSIRRQLIKKSSDVQKKAYEQEYDNPIDLKNDALEIISEIDVNDKNRNRSMKKASEELDEDISRKRNQDNGNEEKYHTGLTDYDYWLDGLHEQEFTIIGARPAVGKEQPLYSKILTPNGWTTMGEISVGTKIIGSDGKTYNITNVFPQGIKDIYRVYFNDDSFADCGLDHLWETKTRYERKDKKNSNVRTTKEILNSIIINKDNRLNHSIKWVKPVEFSEKLLPIHPYVMGALLGDGCLSKENVVRFITLEKDIIENILCHLPFTDTLKIGIDRLNHTIIRKQKTNKKTDTYTELDKMNLIGKKSYEKFIPKCYLYSSIHQRIELLQGLIDTDGHVVHNGSNIIEYSTTSYDLVQDIKELVNSLGGRCTYTSRTGSYKKNNIIVDCRVNYRINISFTNDIIPVSSKKHLLKYKKPIKSLDRFIKNIEFIGKYEAQCIMVDSPDHLYITDNYILTHNTAIGLQIVRNLVKKGLYIPFISLEMSDKQLLARLISSESKINSHKLRKPKLMTDEEYLLYKKTLNDINSLPLQIEELKYIQEIRSYCRQLKSKNKLDALFVDYIQLMLTMKKTNNRNEELGDISRNLKAISKEFNIPVVALAQLNRATEKENREPRLSDLRECGDIEQDADNVIFLHKESDADDLAEIQKRKVIIAKQRNGATGYFPLMFEGKTFNFYNVPKNDKSPSIFMKNKKGG